MKYTEAEMREAKKYLKRVCKKGDTLYTILHSESKSGMTRDISVFVFTENKPICLDFHILRVLTNVGRGKQGLRVKGCGMDMGFHIVYSLSTSLFCEKGYTSRGAYALNHEWL